MFLKMESGVGVDGSALTNARTQHVHDAACTRITEQAWRLKSAVDVSTNAVDFNIIKGVVFK